MAIEVGESPDDVEMESSDKVARRDSGAADRGEPTKQAGAKQTRKKATQRPVEVEKGGKESAEKQVELLFAQVAAHVSTGRSTEAEQDMYRDLLEMGFKTAMEGGQLERFMSQYVELKKQLLELDPKNKDPPSKGESGMTVWVKEELPIFSGRFADWPAFEDAFRLEVADRAEYSEAQKLRKLNACLKGEARQLIEEFGLHEEGAYKEAWLLLKGHYTNSMEAFSEHVQAIVGTAAPTEGDSVGVRNAVGQMRAAARKARLAIAGRDALSVVTATLLLGLMDQNTRDTWRRAQEHPDRIPELDEVAKFYLEKAKSWEDRAKRREGLGQDQVGVQMPKVEARAPRGGGLSCYYCAGDHRLAQCGSFEKASPELRREFLRKRGLCEKCRGPHVTSACGNRVLRPGKGRTA